MPVRMDYDGLRRQMLVRKDNLHPLTASRDHAFSDFRVRDSLPTDAQLNYISVLVKKIEMWRSLTGREDKMSFMPPETKHDASDRIEYLKRWMTKHRVLYDLRQLEDAND